MVAVGGSGVGGGVAVGGRGVDVDVAGRGVGVAVSVGSGGDVGVTGESVGVTAGSGERGVDVVGVVRDSAGVAVVPGNGILLRRVGEDITKILRVGRRAVGDRFAVCFKPNHRVRPEPIVTKVTARQNPINRMMPTMKMIRCCFFLNLIKPFDR